MGIDVTFSGRVSKAFLSNDSNLRSSNPALGTCHPLDIVNLDSQKALDDAVVQKSVGPKRT